MSQKINKLRVFNAREQFGCKRNGDFRGQGLEIVATPLSTFGNLLAIGHEADLRLARPAYILRTESHDDGDRIDRASDGEAFSRILPLETFRRRFPEGGG